MQKNKKWEHLKINRKIESFIKSGFKEECEWLLQGLDDIILHYTYSFYFPEPFAFNFL